MQNDDDLAIAMRSLTEAIGQAQGFNRAYAYILTEILRELAAKSSDPQKYLADMFERISARADQGEIDREAHPVNVEFRWQVENIFKHARPKS